MDKSISEEFYKSLIRSRSDYVPGSKVLDIISHLTNIDSIYHVPEYLEKDIGLDHVQTQHRSGTCWLQSALGVLRYRGHYCAGLPKDFEFSVPYLLLWKYVESVNSIFESAISLRNKPEDLKYLHSSIYYLVGDGGYIHSAPALIQKYGVVPAHMVPESTSYKDTSIIRSLIVEVCTRGLSLIESKSKEGVSVKELRKIKEVCIKRVFDICRDYVCDPPEKFTFRVWVTKNKKRYVSKEYSPQKFFNTYFGNFFSELVHIYDIDYPGVGIHHGEVYEYKMPDVCYRDKTRVLVHPIKLCIPYIKRSIDGNTPVPIYFDTLWVNFNTFGKDVSLGDPENIYLDRVLPEEIPPISKGEKFFKYYMSGEHVCNIVGYTTDKKVGHYWKLENSWGRKKWNVIVTDEWLEKYGYAISIHQSFLPKNLVRKYKGNKVKTNKTLDSLMFWRF